MKKHIYIILTIFVFLFVLRFSGFISYASGTFDIPVIEKSDIVPLGNIKFDTTRLSDNYVYSGTLNSGNTGNTTCGIFVKSSSNITYLGIAHKSSTSNWWWYKILAGSTSGYRNYQFCYYSRVNEYKSVLTSANVPIFDFTLVVDSSNPTSGTLEITDYVNQPFMKYLMNGELSDTVNVNGYGVESVDVGTLTDVKYFVDSSAYNYNPSGTPEFVKWGSTSSTGVDLSNTRYYVEFALEDRTQAYVNGYPASNRFFGDLTGNPIDFFQGAVSHFLSYVLPMDENDVNRARGKLYNFPTYGKVSGLGSVSASSGQYTINAVNSYRSSLSSSSDNDEQMLYNHLNDFQTYHEKGYYNQLVDDYKNKGQLFSFSYNILARIVDTQSGSSGDWLKIDRHNTPYWLGDNYDVFNGGITCQPSYINRSVSFPINSFQTVTENNYTENNVLGPISVGPFYDDNSSSTVDNKYTFTNLEFNPAINFRGIDVVFDYSVTYNDGDNKYILIYAPRPQSQPNEDDNGLGESVGLVRTLAVLWRWYNEMFSPLVPPWAGRCIPVFTVVFLPVLIWKLGRNLLS